MSQSEQQPKTEPMKRADWVTLAVLVTVVPFLGVPLLYIVVLEMGWVLSGVVWFWSSLWHAVFGS